MVQVIKIEEKKRHPCQLCGACCASFRVEFPAIETSVPAALCNHSAREKKIMKGTQEKHRPACVALAGRVGKQVTCEIYHLRSSTCRNFQASYEPSNEPSSELLNRNDSMINEQRTTGKGHKNPRCDEARARHGMAPLRREDWCPRHEEERVEELTLI